MSTVNELRTQRAKSWEKANAFLIAHRDGKGILSAVDTATYWRRGDKQNYQRVLLKSGTRNPPAGTHRSQSRNQAQN